MLKVFCYEISVEYRKKVCMSCYCSFYALAKILNVKKGIGYKEKHSTAYAKSAQKFAKLTSENLIYIVGFLFCLFVRTCSDVLL